MFVVGQFQVGVEPHDHRELLAAVRPHVDSHARGHLCRDLDIKFLLSSQAECKGRLSRLVLEGHDAHADQVTPVNPLVTLSNDRFDAKKEGALGRPVPTGAAAIILPRQDDQIRLGGCVLLGRVKHVEDVARGDVQGLGGGLADELVHEADIAEGSSRHDGVIPASGAKAVEVPGGEALAGQEPGGGGGPGDGAGRGDMVSGHRVAEVEQRVGAGDGRLDRQLLGHPLEEGRMLDVGGGLVPGVQSGLRCGELVPVSIASCYLAVNLLKQAKGLHYKRV